ncbi:hypothetical protein ABZ897_59875 [Nonomuraea sp. NPDC046802]|uniref:hypothetical protein n=1 Tax=Nonomuraea sp. NPDC046802 TaxID=3154919 RepID=UPI00340162CB
MSALSEVEAIGALLERLPHATPVEVLELGRSCPHRHVALQAERLHTKLGAVAGQRPADRWMASLEKLRTRLTNLVAAAHEQAAATEAWLRDIEETVLEETALGATSADAPEPAPRQPAESSPAGAPDRPRGRRDATGPKETPRPPARRGRAPDRQRLIGSTQPDVDDQALVRRLCHRMATSPAEAGELIAMLGVG